MLKLCQLTPINEERGYCKACDPMGTKPIRLHAKRQCKNSPRITVEYDKLDSVGSGLGDEIKKLLIQISKKFNKTCGCQKWVKELHSRLDEINRFGVQWLYNNMDRVIEYLEGLFGQLRLGYRPNGMKEEILEKAIHNYTQQQILDQSPISLAKRYIGARRKWADANKPTRSKKDMKYIYEKICSKCNFFQDGVCGICGCRLHPERSTLNKLAWLTEECSDRPPRWLAFTENVEEWYQNKN